MASMIRIIIPGIIKPTFIDPFTLNSVMTLAMNSFLHNIIIFYYFFLTQIANINDESS